MNSQQLELDRRLQAFCLDDPNAVLPFSKRLARDNGWTQKYALRAIAEYKKFVFLAVAAGYSVTPSEQVDLVWHLHLTYTHSYWNDFCPNVLQMPLHHDPTQGGAAERGKFVRYYDRTLESYKKFFGTPPQDIWPGAEVRFSRNLRSPILELFKKAIAFISQPFPGKIWLLVAIAILSVIFHSFDPVSALSIGDREAPLEVISLNSGETAETRSSPAISPSPANPSNQNYESQSSPPWCLGFWVLVIIWSLFGSKNNSVGGSTWRISSGGGGGDNGDSGCSNGDSGCCGCGGCGGCGGD
ncbi:MAG: hypothetical protein KME17_11560 [Cyanosarcina radialis HA8281-LM2]|jgi:hypothetical protein|nr:hypothetical protein [Cyanosarcina radialis HA8281-LM2]